MLSDERSAPQLQSFLVGGRASSTASDRQHARQPSLHVSTTRAPSYILLLGPYTSVYYVYVIMMSWLVVGSQVKAKRGLCRQKGERWPRGQRRTVSGRPYQRFAPGIWPMADCYNVLCLGPPVKVSQNTGVTPPV